ncbi:MAG: nucleotidyltransferase family protein [Hydrogenophilales bacterium]|nr:nucleotidyltransferase family protein [Hydrogenophilales bacterium]
MNTLIALRNIRQEILAIAARHGAHNVRLFGSVARGDDTTDSDVDILVSMESGRSLYDLIGFQQEIENLLGRHTDVLTENGINRHLKNKILGEATPL